ncbi:DUF1822 family protein [Moorena producens JHB]|uniref:DUF1822 family protein n=1 Tax=Moorena producens (strain JHB) TaxID=1454205 RepID=A0A1D9G4Q4_MOOP1|nr:DUF1822 family protein [Moorena producens]AOY82608.1 DUF1822 family protein [Moorena producens JHB]
MLNTSTEMISFPALTETLTLELEQQQKALDIANQMAEKSGILAIYLQELALLVFEDWLAKREPSLRVERSANELVNSELSQVIAKVINAVCNLRVGDFKICLIPSFGFSDPLVNLPQGIVTIPQFTAHFYVVIAIDDDLGIAGIKGVNRYDQLVKDISNLAVGSDQNYEIPLSRFTMSGDDLLLDLQCLSPQEIPLPEIPDTDHNYVRDVIEILNQRAINVGQWLYNQIDDLAQELSWQLLPAPSPALRFRPTPAQELAEIITIIDIEIPAAAVRSYRDFQLAGIPLRLYAVTWQLPQSEPEGDWTIVLILGASPGNTPPSGIKLRITDFTMVLDQQELTTNDDYLFTQFVGDNHEKFLATITTADETAQTSMLFEFKGSR